MTEAEFKRLAEAGYNRVPLVLETLADLDTPLSIYLKLANRPYTYLLESVEGGERFGRYSFIGLAARTRIVAVSNQISVYRDGVIVEQSEGNPLAFVRQYLQRFKAFERKGLPRFCGGLVGYFGYDAVRWIEHKLAQAAPKSDPLNSPDMLLLQSEELAVVDNLSGKLYLVVYADPTQTGSYQSTRERLEALAVALRAPLDLPAEKPYQNSAADSGFGEQAFKSAVERAKRYIYDGDIMQVVLSQRMSQRFEASPLALYRALRALNPSPYMFYFDLDDQHIVGASPEILVRLEKGAVTLRPIAGTRPRGKTVEEDIAFSEDLRADPKERAEHVMLVDLGRNDVGRVAQVGSVRLTESMAIERYSHVMHIVSNVEGLLNDDLDAIDVLRATFPAGTVSGAPKVRAMEIIDELEPIKRGIYAGAVGYLGFNGDMDVAIAIRTAVLKDQTLHIQAGAGIVADSVPESEWLETCNKAKALLRAAEIAAQGLNIRLES